MLNPDGSLECHIMTSETKIDHFLDSLSSTALWSSMKN